MITNFPTESSLLLDFATLPLDGVQLQPDQIQQAVQLSQRDGHETQQWHTYLNALALFGFQQWLQERAAELTFDPATCSLLQPQRAIGHQAIANLQVGEFKVCLLRMDYPQEVVTLPGTVIDSPEYRAHFYVVIEILEEQEQVQLRGFLPYHQLPVCDSATNQQVAGPMTYELPLSQFDLDPNHLLLYLRCLEPEAVRLPVRVPVASSYLSDQVHRGPQQQAINVGVWLQDQLDELAQQLSWVLLPVLTLEPTALRSPVETANAAATEVLNLVLDELQQQGMTMPPEVRGAYRELCLGQISLRLYAMTWLLPEAEPLPEWSLLLVLGASSSQGLPAGTRAQVSDRGGLLLERQITADNDDPYLYICVVGTIEEIFIVTLVSPTGESLSLAPFAYLPQAT